MPRLALTVCLSLLLSICLATASHAELRAGAAAIVITPGEDMWMSGYASRSAPSAGKVHDLFAKALVIEDESGARSAIITTDLIGLTKAISDETARIAHEATGIPREQLMITASHTHCGPALAGNLDVMFKLDDDQARRVREYTAALPGMMADAVQRAVEQLAPASLEYATAEAGFAVNRRQYTLNGIVIGVNPIGPVDHSVPVLVARGADGKPRAVLFVYACHNTTLSFQQFCGDYAGFAQARIEADLPGTVALFASGCGADANPNPRRDITHARQHGEELGSAVLKAVGAGGRPVAGPVRAAFREVDLALSAPPTREALEAQRKVDDLFIQQRAARLLAEWDADGALATSKPYPVQIMSFGDALDVVALGGEVVVDYALRLKHELGADRTVVIGYANDVMAYIPSLRVLREGGYEADSSNIYYGLYGPWAPTIEETIIETTHELLGR